MGYIFDGKSFALNREQELRQEIEKLEKSGQVPRLVSIIVGKDPASVLYVNLKKKAAERIGSKLEIVSFGEETSKKQLIEKIEKYNKDSLVTGIMVQLPLPKSYSKGDRREVLDSISLRKDVDGLRSDTYVVAPTTCAVLEILDEAINIVRRNVDESTKFVIVGASGHEGTKITKSLNKKFSDFGVHIVKVDAKTKNLELATRGADVVISATGVPGLIKPDMVKEGAILIDVGSPKGDIQKQAYTKASFVSPVPGGVGPMTISCLLSNLVKFARK
jgi:methylenetetrahydrofolate dehydrogenase (NADP+)/methenyltetrahydrofolate cyclohydrolase